MRTKLKRWHIILMSFMALFIAVFASLFSLKADPVDEEQTPEELTENWNMDIVFYDSTVDNGKTPLTEIDWDASDGGYSQGQPRVITVQLNYKNTNAVTTYQPGELKINLKRLIATTKTIGELKVKAAKERILEINPHANVEIYAEFFDKETKGILDETVDYIIDAVDTVSAKIELVIRANRLNIPIISCMGTGKARNPTLHRRAEGRSLYGACGEAPYPPADDRKSPR